MCRRQDLTGKTYNRWTVLSFHSTDENHNLKWLCRCECGTVRPVNGSNLTRGLTKSCGCYQDDQRHQMSDTPVYSVWVSMMQRCTNPKSQSYVNYGGRGIKVCERWLDFENFYEDMGEPDGLTLERVDNDGDYEPGNCMWASRGEQARNNRRNNLITWDGRTQCLTDWCEELSPLLGTSPQTIRTRIQNYGWTVEKAFTTPVNKRGRYFQRVQDLST